MGQIVSGGSSSVATSVSSTKVVPAGYMGEFGNGLWRIFNENGTFVVPANVSKIRVRVVGAGGGRGTGGVGGGGGGGGYAHGEFNVAPGQSFAVTVGVGGSQIDGGSSSFGALISATGGKKGNHLSPYNGGDGGVGVGGDFQASGGKGGTGDSSGSPRCGGGAAGSQLGDGGTGGNFVSGTLTSGGGGVGGGKGGDTAGAAGGGGSPFGNATLSIPAPDIIGGISSGIANPISAVIRFPFDGFTGGGGSSGKLPGPGGGGYAGDLPGLGGGGGQGGGGGGQVLATNASQFGNPGVVIVEW